MISCAWLLDSLASNSLFPWPLSVKREHAFPLSALSWLYGALVSRLQSACNHQRYRFHGLRPIAADKTTLALPESPSLYKRFGAHEGQQGLGPIAVELCCLFDLVSRAPLRFVFDKVCTSEHKLIVKLIRTLKKGDLLLITDGLGSITASELATNLPRGLRISILGVGTREGAPIPLPTGDFLKDNAGEIVFDRLLIERLPPGKVTVAVRGFPVINDATLADAEGAGIHEVAEVIENGSDAPGTILDDCSESFRDRFDKADLVIAKGQGNYETLSEVDKDIYFLLKAKCPVIARDIGCQEGAMILKRSKSMAASGKG